MSTPVQIELSGQLLVDLGVEKRSSHKYSVFYRIYAQLPDGTQLGVDYRDPSDLGETLQEEIRKAALAEVSKVSGIPAEAWAPTMVKALLVLTVVPEHVS